jgi:hypothetical protein
MSGRALAGSRWAAQIRHFDSPVLRMRYRGGLVVNPRGIPEWTLLARTVLRLPDPAPGLTLDEVRVLDGLSANLLLDGPAADGRTPPGWVWTHLFGTRELALVPAEARGAVRFPGGMATLAVDRGRRGVRLDPAGGVALAERERLPEELVDRVEQALGRRLPPGYRQYLAQTNGAGPAGPGVHPWFGFVADQALFGVGRADRHQDLVYASAWFADRLTDEYLAIGYVQGGLLAVRLAEPDAGSIWYLDDDDYRDDDRFGPGEICGRLLGRCADDMEHLWLTLQPPPPWLWQLATDAVNSGRVATIEVPNLGVSLPPDRRPGRGSAYRPIAAGFSGPGGPAAPDPG